ncbi:GNAT family N-acetyltransferase [Actinopolymorpha sp. B17G11]|uniref:GNAT family N-acetyltransferase n=1 Tax=Actinopolymorpha sp. B17G11 TaxID=3160861 RepID=UPI0032E3CE03
MTAGRGVLLPSLDLIRQTIIVETAYTLARLRILERLPGNPIGVAYRHVDDGVVAMMARHIPGFNAVTGLRSGLERHVAPLAEWYRSAGIQTQFELVPGTYDKELGRELSRLGYFQAGFHTSLIREPEPLGGDADAADAAAAVERVTTAEQFDAFLDAYTAGWQIPERAGFKANVQPWLGLPGWQLYLARVDGRPAAAGILFLHDKVGYCADAATDPAFRRRGLQTALLRRRIADAHAAGVEFVCSGADYLSTSHRAMERVGMRVQFVRALWRQLG